MTILPIVSLILLAASFVLPFVIGPILTFRRPGIKGDGAFVQVSEEAARLRFPAKSFQSVAQLEQIGFSLVAHLVSGDEITRVHSMITLMSNRDSKTIAQIARAFTTKHVVNKTVECIAFVSEFADGTEIVTNNNPMVGIFRKIPTRRLLNLPQIDDVWRLHHIHSHYVSERADVPLVFPAPGKEIEYYQQAYKKVFNEQTSAGYLYFDEDTQRYRYTLMSAIIFTWRLLWPVKPILIARKRYRARLIAKAAGVANL
jgi:hypothetical protein